MGDFFANVMANFGTYLQIALTVVGAAAAIATLTPNKSDDKIVQILLDLLNFLGANLGNARNDAKVGDATDSGKLVKMAEAVKLADKQAQTQAPKQN